MRNIKKQLDALEQKFAARDNTTGLTYIKACRENLEEWGELNDGLQGWLSRNLEMHNVDADGNIKPKRRASGWGSNSISDSLREADEEAVMSGSQIPLPQPELMEVIRHGGVSRREGWNTKSDAEQNELRRAVADLQRDNEILSDALFGVFEALQKAFAKKR